MSSIDKTGKSGKGNFYRYDKITSVEDVKFESYTINGKTFNPGDVTKCPLEGVLMGGVLQCEHYGIYVGKHKESGHPMCISKYKTGVVVDRLDVAWKDVKKGDHKGSISDAKRAIQEYIGSQNEECYHLFASNCEDWVQKVLGIDVPTQRSTLVANASTGVIGGTLVVASVVTANATAGLATATAVASTLAGAGSALAVGTTTTLTAGALTMTVAPTAIAVGSTLATGAGVTAATVTSAGVIGANLSGAGVTAAVLAGSSTTVAGATAGGVSVVATSGGVLNVIAKPFLALGPVGWTINGLILAGTIGYAIYAKKKKL